MGQETQRRPTEMGSKEFLLEFEVEGPRFAPLDRDGNELWTLWRIWEKSVDKDQIYYWVQYWENEDDENLVFRIPFEEIVDCYSKEVSMWEDEYGEAWENKNMEPAHTAIAMQTITGESQVNPPSGHPNACLRIHCQSPNPAKRRRSSQRQSQRLNLHR